MQAPHTSRAMHGESRGHPAAVAAHLFRGIGAREQHHARLRAADGPAPAARDPARLEQTRRRGLAIPPRSVGRRDPLSTLRGDLTGAALANEELEAYVPVRRARAFVVSAPRSLISRSSCSRPSTESREWGESRRRPLRAGRDAARALPAGRQGRHRARGGFEAAPLTRSTRSVSRLAASSSAPQWSEVVPLMDDSALRTLLSVTLMASLLTPLSGCGTEKRAKECAARARRRRRRAPSARRRTARRRGRSAPRRASPEPPKW